MWERTDCVGILRWCARYIYQFGWETCRNEQIVLVCGVGGLGAYTGLGGETFWKEQGVWRVWSRYIYKVGCGNVRERTECVGV